jgi:hypothetical protein
MNKWYIPRISLYFFLIFAGLLIIYLPSFKNPPRSDYWSAFYIFQQVDASPHPPNWPSIATFDLWQHGTYRPISHLVPYLEHRIVGPDFIWNHVLNFSAYCISIILLYLLAVNLSLDKILTAALLTVFAFLFSHFDILTWTFQLFSTMSFCAFLLGFIIFLRFLRSGQTLLLIPIGILFLFGMLCFEVYAIWPIAILILPTALSNPNRKLKPGEYRGIFIMLGVIYSIYLIGFLIHRMAVATTGPLPAPTGGEIATGFFLVFFNLLYNGIAVNLFPSISTPLFYNDNVNLGGLLLRWGSDLPVIALWGGVITALLIAAGTVYIYRKRKRRILALLSFLMILYITNFFIVGLSRLTTNEAFYPLSQFRYQYVPNALLALMAAVIIGNLFRSRKFLKIIICLILVPILFFNIYLSHKHVVIIGRRLTPLRTIIATIHSGLEDGIITEEKPLFIDEKITENLPSPSWNVNMAQFMEGTFQWFFPASEMKKFTLYREDAGCIITHDDYLTIKRK